MPVVSKSDVCCDIAASACLGPNSHAYLKCKSLSHLASSAPVPAAQTAPGAGMPAPGTRHSVRLSLGQTGCFLRLVLRHAQGMRLCTKRPLQPTFLQGRAAAQCIGGWSGVPALAVHGSNKSSRVCLNACSSFVLMQHVMFFLGTLSPAFAAPSAHDLLTRAAVVSPTKSTVVSI